MSQTMMAVLDGSQASLICVALPDGAHLRAADPARLAGPVVHHRVELEMPGLAIGTAEIAQGAAAPAHRMLEHLAHRRVQLACEIGRAHV